MCNRRAWKSVQLEVDEISPHDPRPGIHASMSYFRYALAPSSSVGISNTLCTNQHMLEATRWEKTLPEG
jgi:hypothetical protein